MKLSPFVICLKYLIVTRMVLSEEREVDEALV